MSRKLIGDRRAHLAQRLWRRVTVGDPAECWLWAGTPKMSGPKRAATEPWTSHTYPHRVAWMVTHGDIPEGMQVVRVCENPMCCNPSHLALLTPSEALKITRRHSKRRKPD